MDKTFLKLVENPALDAAQKEAALLEVQKARKAERLAFVESVVARMKNPPEEDADASKPIEELVAESIRQRIARQDSDVADFSDKYRAKRQETGLSYQDWKDCLYLDELNEVLQRDAPQLTWTEEELREMDAAAGLPYEPPTSEHKPLGRIDGQKASILKDNLQTLRETRKKPHLTLVD